MANLLKKIIYPLVTTVVLGNLMLCFSCTKTSNRGSTHFKCVTCGDGGACINDTCRCYPGYEGNTCQTQIRNKFLGSWAVTEKGIFSDTVHYSITIEQDFTNILNVNIRDLFEDGGNIQVNAAASNDSLIIPLQGSNGQTIVGAGYIRSNSSGNGLSEIIMRYAVTDSANHKLYDFGYYNTANSPSVWTLPTLL